MSLSQKVAFNTGVQIVSKIITVCLTLVTTILLADYLGAEGLGDYFYLLALVTLFGALADWGTATIGVREIAQEKENPGKLVVNIFALRILLAVLATLVLFLASWFLPLKTSEPLFLRRLIRIVCPLVFLVTTRASFKIIFQSRLQLQKAAVAEITTSFLTLAFSWYVIKAGLGFGPLIWAVIWATLVAVFLSGLLARKTVRYFYQLDKRLISKIIFESLPMGAILLMFTMDNKIDLLMLGALKGSQTVGIWGLCSRIYDVLILGAAFLMNSLLPVISQQGHLSRWPTKLKQIYQKSFDLLLVFGLGLWLLVLLTAPLLVEFLTRSRFNEFTDAVKLLRVLGGALVLAYFNHLTGYTLVALGKQRPYFWIALVSLVFNLVANLIFIPRFSYFGAAGVTILTELLVLIMTTAFIYRLYRVIPSLGSFPKTISQLLRQRGKIF